MNEHTLLKRINQKLASTAEQVRKAGTRDSHVGEYYTVDLNTNSITSVVDLETLAAELGIRAIAREVWKASMMAHEQTAYDQANQLGRRMIKQIVKRRLEAEPKLRLVQGGKRV
jgi:hypothetical protein